MYVITTNNICGVKLEETCYLCWQNSVWDEDGYFWTSKDTIVEIIKEGNNTAEHPFLFKSKKEAEKFANKMQITDFYIEKWQ